uniref:Uncharacterized protein n=1 Tax=Globodera rostochiensis TaxID=31243 RepID=A0A914ICQ4_GLORO
MRGDCWGQFHPFGVSCCCWRAGRQTHSDSSSSRISSKQSVSAAAAVAKVMGWCGNRAQQLRTGQRQLLAAADAAGA